MVTSWQEHNDEVVLTLGRVRSVLQHVEVQTQRRAAEHERMAAWYAEHGDQCAVVTWSPGTAAPLERTPASSVGTGWTKEGRATPGRGGDPRAARAYRVLGVELT